ncbi:hypothetical protein CDEST_01397 [Colletotrichum destructivum]|uniref:Uncharacterized protein n=1 Tax=Colletotrichum destructivum TaxID=34406 RepID=A0AAX4HYX4_9PEZI|nr:hypothetical protein CDEST_01397 [Colletotrichum destructivum]
MSTHHIDLTAAIMPKPSKVEKVGTLGQCSGSWNAVLGTPRPKKPSTLRYMAHRGFEDENGKIEELVVRGTKHMVGPDVLTLVEATESGELVESVKIVHNTPNAAQEPSSNGRRGL